MSNEFYNASGAPSTGSTGSSATQRAEFLAIAAGFALLPTMLGHGNEVVVVNAGGTALTTANAATAQTLLGLAIGTNVQAWDADLDALAALDATVGVLIKTAAATYARRNVVGTANEVTVTNGNGVAGNITLSLPAALVFTGKTVNGGTFNNVTVTNLVSPIIVPSGGTGAATLTQNAVVLGNGVGAVTVVAPGTANNVLVSNGSTWVSGSPPNVASGAQTYLGSDLALNNTAAYFNVINTGSIGAAGQVWSIRALAALLDSAGNAQMQARIWDGSTVYADTPIGFPSITSSGGIPVYVEAIVTLSGPTTFHLSCRDISSTSGVVKTTGAAGTANKATWIVAQRIS